MEEADISLGWKVVKRKNATKIRGPETVPMEFDCSTDDYMDFINKFRQRLSEHPDQCSLQGCPLLAKLRPGYPARWMHVKLASGEHETTLAIRDDNLYLFGFQAGNKTWYEFGISGESEHLIKNSTFLECRENYGSILGGAMNLRYVPLGKIFAQNAVRALSEYQHENHRVDPYTKKALACLIVIFCESARMISHCNTVRNGWLRRDGGEPIDTLQVLYLWNWKNMSRFLLGLGTHPYLKDEIRVTTKEEARRIVHLLLNTQQAGTGTSQRGAQTEPHAGNRQSPGQPSTPAGNRQHQQPTSSTGKRQLQQQSSPSAHGRRRGRALVEVFSLRVNFPVVGTIAVFDGERGQIIYEEQRETHTGKDFIDLVLTGPYKAISADGGSFAIKIDPGESDDSIVPVDSDTLWELECIPDDDDDGDSVIESCIAISLSKTAEVTYAVLSNAVEAIVGATLQLSGDTTHGTTHIHGKITASLQLFDHDDNASVLLFNREKEEKLEVTSAGTILIPLSRSVAAMPLGLPLTIKANLYATTFIHDDTPVEGHFDHTFDLHMGDACSTIVEGIGELRISVDVTSSDYGEGIMSNDSQEIHKIIGKKKGLKINKRMPVSEIRNFLNICIAYVKRRMFK